MIWALATLGLILFGTFAVRLELDWPACFAVGLTCGIVIGTSLMYLQSLLGARWSGWLLASTALVFSIAALLPAGKLRGRLTKPSLPLRDASAAGIAVFVALSAYGALTARMTNADLLYFWGPKAAHFLEARGIDVQFLAFPHYFLMHADYPPLLPLLYVWNSILTGGFTMEGAVLLTPIFLLAAALVLRGYSRSNHFALLLAAVLCYALDVSHVGGGADALLVLFEVLALSATVWRRGPIDDAVVAIALAGAVFTKVEGAAFAAVLLGATFLVRRSWKPLMTSIPAAILIGSWILFSRRHGLLDAYGGDDTGFHPQNLGLIAKVAGAQISYSALYLPWIASIAPLAFSRSLRAAAIPLLAAVGCIAYTLYFYLHAPDPVWWIEASVERVLLTSLAAFVVASAAVSE